MHAERRGTDAEHAGSLFGPEAEHVGQDHRCALTWREAGERPNGGVGVQLLAVPQNEKLAAVLGTDGKTLVVSGVKRKNRESETLDAKQLAGHMGKRAQRGKLADVGFRADRLGE